MSDATHLVAHASNLILIREHIKIQRLKLAIGGSCTFCTLSNWAIHTSTLTCETNAESFTALRVPYGLENRVAEGVSCRARAARVEM